MKILILNWRDISHPLSGGAEVSLFEHAKYWSRKGEKVLWFASSFKGGKSQEDIEGIRIIRKGSYYTVHIHAFFYCLFRLSKKDVDIVIDNFHFTPFFTPFYINRKKIIAFINEPAKNNWFKNLYFPFSLIGFLIEPLFFMFYHKIPFITASSSIAEELKGYGIKTDNIRIIHHGISIIKFDNKRVNRERNAIIYFAQLSEDKGIEDALKAFAILSKTNKKLVFWVVGKAKSQSYEAKIRHLVITFRIADRVKFFGYVSEKKKFELLSKSLILVHPSSREGWGLNVIEANSQGTPAVGYNVTGLRDSILHMKTGILTEKDTALDLVNSLNLVISDQKLYQRLSKNAIEWSKNFSWNKAGEMSWKFIKFIYEKNN